METDPFAAANLRTSRASRATNILGAVAMGQNFNWKSENPLNPVSSIHRAVQQGIEIQPLHLHAATFQRQAALVGVEVPGNDNTIFIRVKPETDCGF